jgi:hypothetical protein
MVGSLSCKPSRSSCLFSVPTNIHWLGRLGKRAGVSGYPVILKPAVLTPVYIHQYVQLVLQVQYMTQAILTPVHIHQYVQLVSQVQYTIQAIESESSLH